MNKIVFIFSICLLTLQIFAQVDTTYLKEFWPLGLGDTWQYYTSNWGYPDTSNPLQVFVKDTVLQNGMHYAVKGMLPNFASPEYDRIDAILRVQWGGPCDTCTQIFNSCGGTAPTEISIYHLGDTVGSIWRNCINWNGFLGIPLIRYSGIRLYPVFGKMRESMVFQFGYYDYQSKDTVFATEDILVRGIGLFRRAYFERGDYEQLSGAIVNGITYGKVVSVNEPTETIPRKINLYQNYPNPFNPTTIINYSLIQTCFVTLKIYDVLGNEIITLLNAEKSAGFYKVKFDASKFPSGIYFYQLKTNSILITKKMLLLR
jgi:hypothetical protein